MGGACSTFAEMRFSWWKAKRPLGRHRRRWEASIKVDLREIVWNRVDLIDLAQNRDRRRAVVNTVMNHRVP
jgi:hypothetical protein